MIPIAPIIANVLGLGIPLITEAINKRKGKKAARQASAKAASVLSNVQMAVAGATGATDLGLGQTGTLPEDVSHLPEWMQYAYFGLFIAGLVLKFVASRMKKIADNEPQ